MVRARVNCGDIILISHGLEKVSGGFLAILGLINRRRMRNWNKRGAPVNFDLKRLPEWRKIAVMAKRVSKDIGKDRLAELKAKHFTLEGREGRVARALEILNLPGPSFNLDKETWIWVAQDMEIEDI